MIEKAQMEDLEEILSLQRLAYQSEAELCNDFTIPPLTQTLDGMKQDYQNQIILKLAENGVIIGSVRAFEEKGICYIGRLIVHPSHQNKGIGKLLLHAIEEYFGESRKYSLFTGKHSPRNLYFYDKMGYKIVREDRMNEKVVLVFLEKSNVID